MQHLVHNTGIVVSGFRLPPFKLTPGKCIRIYVPNFSVLNEPLGADLALELIALLRGQRAGAGLALADPLPYARNFPLTFWESLLFPISLRTYLHRKCQVSYPQADEVLRRLSIPPAGRWGSIGLGRQRMAVTLALLARHEAVVFDYYGLSPVSTEQLNVLITQELAQGKCLIGFDNAQYMEPTEPDAGFERIVLEYVGE
ncbi:hypothetical protein [Hymenobacter chitinivorans]|uniref:Uncharacterized protein n=1 Tax=Hymenobacter chitinivorans DSM 11115 TaxID=1121954 RepID=A0A2M9BQ21_9BACT|nr:hypothetical protein [Hymenobacter chitinivorans]PJJ60018.1 hypothetical protein CLV45_1443 [Hymenobacter chitinivorans DSM 11115]